MSTISTKCPNCGGPLHYHPEIAKNKCEYCLSEYTNEELDRIYRERNEKLEKEEERASDEIKESVEEELHQNEQQHMKGYVCNSCGAEVVTEETTAATFCYYCHNPIILSDRISGEFTPDQIIPFSFSKEKATEAFLTWAKSNRFVPRSFYSASQLEKMTGMYIPNWLATMDSKVNFVGNATKLRVWVVGDLEYTEVKEFAVERKGNIDMNRLQEIAIKKIDHGLLSSIEPYDASKAVDFNANYLNGFFSERYDIKTDELEDKVQLRAKQYVNSLVRDSLTGFDSVKFQQEAVETDITEWTYALYPAWILTYQYGGRMYIYAVNGQTGKAYGELPLDRKKLIFVSLGVALLVFALLLLGGYFIW